MARPYLPLFFVSLFLLEVFPPVSVFAKEPLAFTSPVAIDAFSVRLEDDAEYQYLSDGTWSTWETLTVDGDGSPGETESELVMLPTDVTELHVRGVRSLTDIHPITVSHAPVAVRTAATGPVSQAVFSRGDWGADEDYLFHVPTTTTGDNSDATRGDNGVGSTADTRLSECDRAQIDYPSEFRVSSTVTKDAQGRNYLWPLQYSPSVKLLVVHHTALGVAGDPRPAVERVRALYKYHALTKGWGDIGYHYVVDEGGRVYEGKVGGKGVVGGHAYCNNIGTVGIVLMGNFENEEPSQKQAKALQHLLSDLASEYRINLQSSVRFHGKNFDSPVVRHRDLLSTLCPGYYLAEAFGQVVKNVQTKNLDASVRFPVTGTASSSGTDAPVPTAPLGLQEGIAFTGRTTVNSNPGGKQRLSFTYTAGSSGAYEGKKIGDILAPADIKLFVDDSVRWVQVTKGVLLPTDVPAYETVSIQMVVEAPINPGNYSFSIAGIRFTLGVSGRRARTGTYVSPYTTSPRAIVRSSSSSAPSVPVTSRVRPQSRRTLQTSSSSSSSFRSFQSLSPLQSSPSSSPEIRVKLSASENPILRFSAAGTAAGTHVPAGTEIALVARAGECAALSRGSTFASGPILRFLSSNPLTVSGIANAVRQYDGVMECRVIGSKLTLINELPLESYMAGLAEEPDTEPHQKQRAFAVAARTYAAYYLSSDHRKFPGMPYDASDSPAEFQSYAGLTFTANNPGWLRAVRDTAHQVLRYQGELFKPAYFSSDDGRTRSPEEIGWRNFPAGEIFGSKQDPWCSGLQMRGHGVGMSGCGAKGQAQEGKTGEQILQYYYPEAQLTPL